MTKSIRGALPVALAIAAVAAPAAAAAPVSVNLRVEGASKHDLRRPRHHRRAHDHDRRRPAGRSPATAPTPAPSRRPSRPPPPRSTTAPASTASPGTPTGSPSFSDFSVNARRPATAANTTQFWGLVVNFQFSQTGGCTTRVNNGDEVLWVFDAFSKTHVLRLAGPATATTGVPVQRPRDRRPGRLGRRRRHRQRADHRRRRHGVALVRRTRASTSSRPSAPTRSARTRSRSASTRPVPTRAARATRPPRPSPPTCPAAGSPARAASPAPCWSPGRPATPTAPASPTTRSTCARSPTARRPAPPPTTGARSRTTPSSRGVHFRGDSGSAYEFRITAVDRAGNRTSIETDPLVLPVDDRDRGLWKLSRGWKRIRQSSAWGGTVVRADEARRDRQAALHRPLGLAGRTQARPTAAACA